MAKEKMILVYSVFPKNKKLNTCIRTPIAKSLAVCANVFPQIKSHYIWNGKIETATEVAVIFKTKRGLKKQLMKEIKSTHTYEVPFIGVLSVEDVNEEYLAYIKAST